jgi:hypothetical protein
LNYIKTECFSFPRPANRLGNAGRNTLIGRGLLNVDFSVLKNNRVQRISEIFNVQFRAECFNVLNHPNFSPPVKQQHLIRCQWVADHGRGPDYHDLNTIASASIRA